MKFVSVWSEPECNSGVALAHLGSIASLEWSESLTGDRGSCALELLLTDPAIAAGSIAIYNVLRIVDDDDTVYEYRIIGLDDTADGATVRITGSSLVTDMGRPMVSTTAGGTTLFDFTVTEWTVSQLIDTYILPVMSASGMGYFARGSVDSALSTVSITWSAETPLSLLGLMAKQLSCEVWVTRNGSTNYLINVGQRTTATTVRVEVGINAIALSRSIIADERFITRAWPQGLTAGSDPSASTVESVLWRVASVASDWVTLDNPSGGTAPVIGDDQFNGKTFYAQLAPIAVPWWSQSTPSANTAFPTWYDSGNDCYWVYVAGIPPTYGNPTTMSRVGKYVPSTGVWTWYNGPSYTDASSQQYLAVSLLASSLPSFVNGRIIIPQTSQGVHIFTCSTQTWTRKALPAGWTYNYVVGTAQNYCFVALYDSGPTYRLWALALDGSADVNTGLDYTIGGVWGAPYYEPGTAKYWIFQQTTGTIKVFNSTMGGVVTASHTCNLGTPYPMARIRVGNRLYSIASSGWACVGDITNTTTSTNTNATVLTNPTTGAYTNADFQGQGTVTATGGWVDGACDMAMSHTTGRMYFTARGANVGGRGERQYIGALDCSGSSNAVSYDTTFLVDIGRLGNASSDAYLAYDSLRKRLLVQQSYASGFLLPMDIGATGVPSPFIKLAITDTDYSGTPQRVRVASSYAGLAAGQWVSFRADTSGGVIQSVDHTANIATYGLVEGRPSYRVVGRTSLVRHGTLTNEYVTALGQMPAGMSFSTALTLPGSAMAADAWDYETQWSKADAASATYTGATANGTQSPSQTGTVVLTGGSAGLVLQPGDVVAASTQGWYVRKRTVLNGSGAATVPIHPTTDLGSVTTGAAITLYKFDLANVTTGGRAAVLLPREMALASGGGSGAAASDLRFAFPIVGNASRGSYWVTVLLRVLARHNETPDAQYVTLRLWRADRTYTTVAGSGTGTAGTPLGVTLSAQVQLASSWGMQDQWVVGSIEIPASRRQAVFIEQIIVHQGDTAHTATPVLWGANDLYAAAARALTSGRATPTISYSVELLDQQNAVAMGATARLFDASRYIQGATSRIVAVRRVALPNGSTASPQITLDSRDLSLVDSMLALEV